MPAAARMAGVDIVNSPDGAGLCCASPSTQQTAAGSPNVIVNGVGIVRAGDPMVVHPFPGPCCVPHAPGLTSFSPNVYANGKLVGRLGDDYSAHVIASGSPNVFVNG